MKKLFVILFILVIVVAGITALGGTPQKTAPESTITVATTIFPVYDLARSIGGDAIDVELLVPSGASEHTWEPSPSTIRQLQQVDVVYTIDHGIDHWLEDIIGSTDAKTVVLDAGIEIRAAVDEHEAEEEAHSPTDPHYWLTVPNAMRMAQTIANDLTLRYPEQAETFTKNLEVLLSDLETADAEIRDILSGVENRNLITLHDAWYYFAEEYDLAIVGTFEPSPGREPTPQYLVELMDAIEASRTSVLYSEPQLSLGGLETFAEDNDLAIAELDPVGGIEGRDTYIKLMKYNAETIAQNQ